MKTKLGFEGPRVKLDKTGDGARTSSVGDRRFFHHANAPFSSRRRGQKSQQARTQT